MNPLSISWFSLLFLILLQAPSGSSNAALYYKTCGNTFSCGKSITKIGFPFRRLDDPLYCGHPSFTLTCDGDDDDDDDETKTNINIMRKKYRVLEIDQNNQTMRIAREDVMDKTCPEEKVNTTLDHSIFDYDSSCRNFTFLYGCPVPIPGISPISCDDESVYVIPGSTGPGGCKESVIVPVTRDESQGPVNATELNAALQQGFEIKYKVDSEACSDCTASTGRCGYDVERNKVVCYCPHPPYITDHTCTMADDTSTSPNKPSFPKAKGTYLL